MPAMPLPHGNSSGEVLVHRPPDKFTIFRVPERIRQLDTQLYSPRLVSIGPYHHGEKDLRAMERHKQHYLQIFLSLNPDKNYDEYLAAFKDSGLVSKAISCYFVDGDLVDPKNIDAFSRVLFLDAVFIIVLALINFKRIKPAAGEQHPILRHHGAADFKDPILDHGWSMLNIKTDLMILDNQIPFFVLQKIYQLLNPSAHPNDLIDILAMLLCSTENGGGRVGTTTDHVPSSHGVNASEVSHLLHLCYMLVIPTSSGEGVAGNIAAVNGNIAAVNGNNNNNGDVRYQAIPSEAREAGNNGNNGNTDSSIPRATDLDASGVKIRATVTDSHMFDVKFKNGVLEIPHIRMDHASLSRFISLVAFEQCGGGGCFSYMTSYARFMHNLVSSPEDVELLQKRGVVHDFLSSPAELVLFFNRLNDSSTIDYSQHHLRKVYRELNHYCKPRWRKHKAMLMKNHFSNPWRFLSVMAVAVGLILTFLQTFTDMYVAFGPGDSHLRLPPHAQ